MTLPSTDPYHFGSTTLLPFSKECGGGIHNELIANEDENGMVWDRDGEAVYLLREARERGMCKAWRDGRGRGLMQQAREIQVHLLGKGVCFERLLCVRVCCMCIYI